ncbi:head-tail connector protein [Anaeromassilibacillus senegalensis]|uniref:head-tail connector protein n=1 Tax=Anaeromassilibacillus senegalensis TaxID=1673717 RepID=UPI001A9A4FA8|nr:head-tail connector protein [Anaeromassilibacillus senegalensis]
MKYARVDQREIEYGAKIIFDAAEAYITEAIDQKSRELNEANPAYRLAVCMLFSHWYDNREAVGNDKDLGFGLRNLISQLQAGALQEDS